VAVPATGGAGWPVFSFRAPADWDASIRLDASPSRAVTTVERSHDTDPAAADADAVRTFSGPPLGPWAALGPVVHTGDDAGFPVREQVEGDTVFTTVSRGNESGDVAIIVRDPNPREVPLPEGARNAIFAGDLVAYELLEPTEAHPFASRVVIANWRTGAAVRVIDFRDGIDALVALRPDGRFAVTLGEHDDVYDMRPGRAPQRLTHYPAFPPLAPPRYAGDYLVFQVGNRLRRLDPDGHVRTLGTPTAQLDGFTADDTRVLWWANDCLLIAPVTAPTAPTIGKGPCPRSEIALDNSRVAKLARSLPVRLRCVAAPTNCRGTVWLRALDRTVSAHQRYTIQAGRTRTVRVPLTPSGYAVIRRLASALVVIRGDDGDRFGPYGDHGIDVQQ
jgi:hypothetical protein